MTPMPLAMFLMMHLICDEHLNLCSMMPPIFFYFLCFNLVWANINYTKSFCCEQHKVSSINIHRWSVRITTCLDFSYFFIHLSNHIVEPRSSTETIGIIKKYKHKNLNTFAKSLVSKRKNIDLITNPCGTPHPIDLSSGFCPLHTTDCQRLKSNWQTIHMQYHLYYYNKVYQIKCYDLQCQNIFWKSRNIPWHIVNCVRHLLDHNEDDQGHKLNVYYEIRIEVCSRCFACWWNSLNDCTWVKSRIGR